VSGDQPIISGRVYDGKKCPDCGYKDMPSNAKYCPEFGAENISNVSVGNISISTNVNVAGRDVSVTYTGERPIRKCLKCGGSGKTMVLTTCPYCNGRVGLKRIDDSTFEICHYCSGRGELLLDVLCEYCKGYGEVSI